MKLYNFFRSGTSHRLRIALNLKGLAYEYVPVDLRAEQHLGADYRKRRMLDLWRHTRKRT
jgi:maleylpyruvate isomerase